MTTSDKAGSSILDKTWASTTILIVLIAAVVLIWFFLPSLMVKTDLPLAEKGQYGDSYGSVNALFTGLAFAGLVFTIFLQQREIKLQRADFDSQLKEMKESREEVAKQVANQEEQIKLSKLELKFRVHEATMQRFQSMNIASDRGHGSYSTEMSAIIKDMTEALEKSEINLTES